MRVRLIAIRLHKNGFYVVETAIARDFGATFCAKSTNLTKRRINKVKIVRARLFESDKRICLISQVRDLDVNSAIGDVHIPTGFLRIEAGTRSIHALKTSLAFSVFPLLFDLPLLHQPLLFPELFFSCSLLLKGVAILISQFLCLDSELFVLLITLLIDLTLPLELRDKFLPLRFVAFVHHHCINDPGDTDNQSAYVQKVQLCGLRPLVWCNAC